MRINFERSGGFAAIGFSGSIETDDLEPDTGREVVALVESSRFFEIAEDDVTGGGGADQFQYAVTVDDGTRSRTLHIGDESRSAELAALLRRLTVLSRSSSDS